MDEHNKNHNDSQLENMGMCNNIDRVCDKTYCCPECKLTFASIELLQAHLDDHSDTLCILCEQNFSQQELLMRHFSKMHETGKPFTCIYCQIDCQSLSVLRSHLSSHRKEIDMLCSECGQKFSYRRDYERHIQSHSRHKPISYECSFSSEKLKSLGHLENHCKQHENLPPSSCVTCEKNFPDAEQLKSHMLEHTHHVCCYCESKFIHLSDLRRHVELHKLEESEKQETICHICLTGFLSSYKLKSHMLTHKSDPNDKNISEASDVSNDKSGARSYSCSECDGSFDNKKDFEKHLRTHSVTCTQCNELFEDQRALSFHLKEVHPTENLPIDRDSFLCSVCGIKFLTKKGLNNHMYEHTGEAKQYVCVVCNHSMNSSSLLEEHMRRHNGDRPYMCDQCAKQFTTRSGLKIHQQCHTSERSHVCPVCKKGFTRAGSLRVHMAVHTGNRPYGCTICPKTFHHEANLMDHLKMHTGDKPFICNICQKRFSLQQYLKQHEKIHNPTKQYKCQDCDKRFATPQGVYQHSRTHRGRPFLCSQCNRRFTHMQTLRIHLQKHAGTLEKRFQCQVCDKCFATAQGLYQHRRTHRDKAFSCDLCDKTFAKFRELKAHLNTHSEVDMKRKVQKSVWSNGETHVQGWSEKDGATPQPNTYPSVTTAESNFFGNQLVQNQQNAPNVSYGNNQFSNVNSFGNANVSTGVAYSGTDTGIKSADTTVYYEPTVGLLFFEQPEMASQNNHEGSNAQSGFNKGVNFEPHVVKTELTDNTGCSDSGNPVALSQQQVDSLSAVNPLPIQVPDYRSHLVRTEPVTYIASPQMENSRTFQTGMGNSFDGQCQYKNVSHLSARIYSGPEQGIPQTMNNFKLNGPQTSHSFSTSIVATTKLVTEPINNMSNRFVPFSHLNPSMKAPQPSLTDTSESDSGEWVEVGDI